MPDNVFTHLANLQKALTVTVEVLTNKGFKVYLKQRDKNEPRRNDKLKIERKIQAVFVKRFRRQLEVFQMSGVRKTIGFSIDIPDWEEQDLIDELITLLFTAAKGGIEIFAEQVLIGMDYTVANGSALEFARKYAYLLVRGIDETTKSFIEKAVSGFIETPGFALSDIIDLLQPAFGDARAAMIAVTETTRAYASGQIEAAKQLQAKYPDFTVIKTWETNNDDRVCDICGPNQGQEIGLDEAFSSGDTEPPAHVNCRCWINYYTKEGRDANQ